MTKLTINYKAEPTPARFHKDPAFARCLLGAFGSGKSVACVNEMVMRSAQAPVCTDNVRRSRWAVIRGTYPELTSTTIKTFEEWYPATIAPIKYSSPIECHMALPLPDGTQMEAEFLFLAMERPQDTKRLLSLELTGAWLNEARELPYEIMEMVTGRLGRYPPQRLLPENADLWRGVIIDTNPPDDDHWIYRVFEDEQPDGYRIYKQPPALLGNTDEGYRPNPDAENVRNHQLGYDYWLQQVPGKSREWIRVHLQGEYGSTVQGKPVYPEFVDREHTAEAPIQVLRGQPLLMGLDAGLTPAAIIGQMDGGQLNIIDELTVDDRGMGCRQFIRDVVKPHLSVYYRGMDIYAWIDPAANHRGEVDAVTVVQAAREEDFPVRLAPDQSNSFQSRREAVASFLTRRPGLKLSPNCKTLRKGFQGRYCYERLNIASVEPRYQAKAVKSWYSHAQDALQYLALGATHGYEVPSHMQQRSSTGARKASAAGY